VQSQYNAPDFENTAEDENSEEHIPDPLKIPYLNSPVTVAIKPATE
jgi:hypothetical protein